MFSRNKDDTAHVARIARVHSSQRLATPSNSNVSTEQSATHGWNLIQSNLRTWQSILSGMHLAMLLGLQWLPLAVPWISSLSNAGL